ncbi:MAG: hypothetical protein JXR84_06440 [Anaerolineae bacterium]|nr:hypothetical protein [Anaerolineae bacterium]
MTEQTTSTLQDFPLPASIEAVKTSTNFETYDDFYRYMVDNLPQNSPETRRRYANLIGKRYFPGLSLDTLLPKVWKTYQDEQILVDLMRVLALEAEPIISEFVLEKIWPLAVGQVLDGQIARDFIQSKYGKFIRKSRQRLIHTVRNLGFLGLYGQELVVEAIPSPANALLILLHDRFAPTPRIVRLVEILDAVWWRQLGLKTPDDVRRILHEAQAAGLIARYVKVDQLEQITTRFSINEYISQAKRL